MVNFFVELSKGAMDWFGLLTILKLGIFNLLITPALIVIYKYNLILHEFENALCIPRIQFCF